MRRRRTNSWKRWEARWYVGRPPTTGGAKAGPGAPSPLATRGAVAGEGSGGEQGGTKREAAGPAAAAEEEEAAARVGRIVPNRGAATRASAIRRKQATRVSAIRLFGP